MKGHHCRVPIGLGIVLICDKTTAETAYTIGLVKQKKKNCVKL